MVIQGVESLHIEAEGKTGHLLPELCKMLSLQYWQGLFWPVQDAAVPGRSQAGLEVPYSQQAACCRGLRSFPGTQGVRVNWPRCCHTFNAPRCSKSPLHCPRHLAAHGPGCIQTAPRSWPVLRAGWDQQLENRILPSQAGSPRMLGASTWLLKHSYTGSSSPRDATAYCCKHGALPQILWQAWIFSMF